MKKKKKRFMCRIEEGKHLYGFYVITLALHKTDQLDIMEAAELYNPLFREASPLIVGLACDYTEAMDILYQIIDDARAFEMPGRLRAFIELKEGLH